MSLIVVKVGGSLYDLPELGPRLTHWLERLDASRVLLVPGGGAPVDAIRQFCELHRIDEEPAHWLALRALAANAHFLATLLAKTPVVEHPQDAASRWAILDAHAFLRADEALPDHLPHLWAVTSDSIAARAARLARAQRLILLKSVSIPPSTSWDEAARRGWVDSTFADVVPSGIQATPLNFRDETSQFGAQGEPGA